MSNSGEGSNRTRKSTWDVDLDNPSSFEVAISTSEATGSSRPSKQKKGKTAHDKDPTYPPTSYTNYAYEVCLKWYADKSSQFLETNFLRNKSTGIDKLKKVLEEKIRKNCRESSNFADVDEVYYSQCQTWIDNVVQACTFNTKKLMIEFRPLVPGLEESHEAKEFREKMEWWQKAVKTLSKSETRGIGWQNDALKASLARDGGSCLTWIYPEATVVPLTAYDREGGHGKVRKVRIEGMDRIPCQVPFAGKVSKAKNPRDARVERSTEALVCPLNHPAIIKFWGVHAQTMEAYTLWWNGGNLRDMFGLNGRVVAHASWRDICRVHQLPNDDRQRITLFRRHKSKLAWALVYVASLMHRTLVLHNDLSPMNIMLHFPEFSNEIINIGICDWGISSRIHEGAPSHYGYRTEEKKLENMQGRWWVAPELFYVYGEAHTETSLEIMQAAHRYTVQSDSYSIGKLAQGMKINDGDEFDKDVFKNREALMYFSMKLGELADPDHKKRPTCAQVVNLLMGKPWFMKPPEAVFRDSVL